MLERINKNILLLHFADDEPNYCGASLLASIKNWLARTTRASFFRSVLVLVGGTAFAQGLTVLILPVLTRLYTPADFSTLAVYASLLAVLGSVACLRYEIAISLPEDDRDGVALMLLALASAALWGLIIGGLLYLFGERFFDLIDHPELTPFSWLLPLGVWLQGSYSALQYWTSRKRSFGRVARTRLGQSLTGATTQIALGWANVAPLGLVLGHFLNSCAGVVGLGTSALKDHRQTIASVSLKDLRQVGREYSRFPRYSTFESLANAGAMQFPVLLIAALAVGPEAGYLLLATRVMAAPMGLVGNSIAQVYLSGAPTHQRNGSLDSFTASVITGLIKTGVGPLIFVGIVAPSVFPVVFGEEWRRAGELISWMTPWFVMQFLSSPVSMVLHVSNNQNVALYLQIFGLLLRTGLVFAAFALLPGLVTEAYAFSGLIFYLIYFLVVLNVARISIGDLFRIARKGFAVVLFWVAAGLALEFYGLGFLDVH